MSFAPGDSLASYHIQNLLGIGGMAEVYQVRNENLNRDEALKLLSDRLTADRDFVARFLREAQTAAQLHHPNIATIYSVSPTETTQPYFTMELIEGVDLVELLRSRGGRLPEAEVVALLTQVASGLDYAHSRNVIHRDIKPANVLINKDSIAKIVDFGIARAGDVVGGARLTQMGMIVGTPEYMSPEQARGDATISAATDQYSLAIVAYELLTGRVPFVSSDSGSTMQVLMSHAQAPVPDPHQFDISEAARQALLKALSKESHNRFPSCMEFVRALVSPSTPNQAVVSKPVTNKPIAHAPSARNFMPIIVFTGIVGFVLIGYAILRPKEVVASGSPTVSIPQNGGASLEPKKETITIPDLKGMTEDRAREEALKLGLAPSLLGRGSSLLPKDVVCEQIPPVGDQVEKGSKLEYRLSLGPKDDPAITPEQVALPVWRQYRSESLPITLEIPSDWTAESGKSNDERWITFKGGQGAVIRIQFSSDRTSLDPYGNFLKLSQRHGGTVSPTGSLAGLSGASWVYTKLRGDHAGKHDEEIGVAYGDNGVTFEAIAPADVYDSFRPLFDRSRGSLVLR